MFTGQELQRYNLFSGLEEKELNEIANLCTRRTYGSNEIIFGPDIPSEDLLLVEDGKDAIEIQIPLGPYGNKIVIHTLSKGEAFAWTSLVSQHVKTATARSLEPVSLIAINGKALMRLLEANNHIGFIVMRNLADIINSRLAYTTVAFRHETRRLKSMVGEQVRR